jgi:hypothetical protein
MNFPSMGQLHDPGDQSLLDQHSLNNENPTQAQTDTTKEIPLESSMPFWD